jgi:hypothetical protein
MKRFAKQIETELKANVEAVRRKNRNENDS